MPQGRQVVFDAISSNRTVGLHQFDGLEPTTTAGSILIEVTGSAISRFDLNIQGKVHERGKYTNVDYQEIFKAGESTVTNKAVQHRGSEHTFYLVSHPPPLVQLKAVSIRGTFTAFVSFISIPFEALGFDNRIITALDAILQELIRANGLHTDNGDALERIQQQVAKINEDENLAPGDRHYGSS